MRLDTTLRGKEKSAKYEQRPQRQILAALARDQQIPTKGWHSKNTTTDEPKRQRPQRFHVEAGAQEAQSVSTGNSSTQVSLAIIKYTIEKL